MSSLRSIWVLAPVIAACGGIDPPSNTGSVDATAADLELVVAHVVLYADPAVPGADAVGVRGGKIVAIGASAELAGRCGAGCSLVEGGGRFLMPGFHDAHVHLYGAGKGSFELAVSGTSLPAIQKAVAAWAAEHPKDPWILGRGFHLGGLAKLPTHADLDAAGVDRPVAIVDHSGHNLWVNAKAIALAGVTKDTPDPPNGTIVRDANGEPTGIFEDGATALVLSKVPEPSDADIERFILAGEKLSLTAGVTASEGGPVTLPVAEAYARLDAQGKLRQRTFLWASLGVSDAVFAQWVDFAKKLPDSGRVELVAFKGFADGVLQARTAALLQPYSDAPGTKGNVYLPADKLAPLAVRANQAGFPVAVHAIGDAAVRAVLDGFELARATAPTTIVNRVEHASLVDPADAPRFASLNVAASVQPVWIAEGSPVAALGPFLGPERIGRLYPWGSLAGAGATLLFGSDMPSSEQDDPVAGLHGAITRSTSTGAPFAPEEAIDPDVALRAFTSTPADAIGVGASIGRLAIGYAADLVLLATDPRSKATSLADDPVEAMWIGGAPITP